jgi:endonuclease/exonuclease/phosphatase family metal-dependent hydrolase
MAARKLSFFGKTLLFLNVLAVLFLSVTYLSAHISPSVFWPIAFAALLYPAALIINVFFVILWILFRRWLFLISLVAILVGYGHVLSFVQWNNINKPLPETGINLHVLSYNVRVFDLYNYGPQWQLNFTQRNNIFRFFDKNDFDILCLQEFVYDKSGAFKTLDTLPRFLKARHIHTGYTRSSKGVNFFGLATLSKFPIINKGMIKFPTGAGNLCIFSDIVVGKDTLRVYNVHFESIGLSPEDLLFVENMTNVEQISDRRALQTGSVQILRRMRRAYIHRAAQVELVAQSIAACPYPVILAGDFNDTPASYAYARLTALLSDAFLSGRGTGQTYVGNLPGFRIDYVLHSQEFSPFNFRTVNQKYSDHYPISVWLNFQPGK